MLSFLEEWIEACDPERVADIILTNSDFENLELIKG